MTVLEQRSADPKDTGQELERLLRRDLEGEVAFDDYTRHLFSRDASMYSITPLGVAFPRHADDVAAAVAAAATLGVPVVPRGAGTSLAGQTVGPGLVLDMSRHLDRILELDPRRAPRASTSAWCRTSSTARPAPHGLMFGPDTSTSNRATIGGMIGNNSAGSGSRCGYGMTIDHVRALDVVLSDGSRATFEPVDDAERERRAAADTLEGSALPRAARHRRAAPRRHRARLPAVLAPRLRLPARPARRRDAVRPGEVRGRLRGHPGRHHPGAGRPGAEAASHRLRGRPLHIGAGGDRRHRPTRCPATPRRSR